MTNKFYLSKAWRAVRQKRLRQDNYTCQLCSVKCLGAKRGCPTPHVDHVETLRERPDLALSLSNLRTLCPSCHNSRTRADQLGEGKTPIGPDGYPVGS